MNVVRGYPPNIEEIRARLAPRPTSIFAYGSTIYSPSGNDLPDDLLAHEEVHALQQRAAGGPAAWWARYLDDPAFRLEQEVAAYRAQLRASAGPRHERKQLLTRIARDLASPMYGNLVTLPEARALIAS